MNQDSTTPQFDAALPAERKWYQKKRFAILGVLFGLAAISNAVGGGDSEPESVAFAEETEVAENAETELVNDTETEPAGNTETEAEVTEDIEVGSEEPVAELESSVELPDSLTYTIIEDNRNASTRSIEVALSEKLTAEQLELLGNRLRDEESTDFERTGIGYYVPTSDQESTYWASTHFAPDIDVQINGATIEEEEIMRATDLPASDENIIDVWIDEGLPAARITLYTEDGSVWMERLFADGSSGVDEMAESTSDLGRRFDWIPDRGFGEFLIITPDGILEMHNSEFAFARIFPA